MPSRTLFETRLMAALGWRFVIRGDPEVVGILDETFRDLARTGPGVGKTLARGPDAVYIVERREDDWEVREQDEPIATYASLSAALGALMWDVNRRAALAAGERFVVFHAACVVRDGVGVLLPGPAGSGKTTVAAGLLQAGFSYVTDEAAALDPRTMMVHAYPKPLTVDPGAHDVLGGLGPEDPRLLAGSWQVPASRIGSLGHTAIACPQVVIAPTYGHGAETALRAASRAEMLMDLAACTFHFSKAPTRTLAAAAALLRRSDAYRLDFGDLDEAVEAIRGVTPSGEVTRETVHA